MLDANRSWYLVAFDHSWFFIQPAKYYYLGYLDLVCSAWELSVAS